jgi:hypothetical protein
VDVELSSKELFKQRTKVINSYSEHLHMSPRHYQRNNLYPKLKIFYGKIC